MHITKRYYQSNSIRLILLFILLNGYGLFAQNTLIINEVMSVNKDFMSDEDGMYSDWIELHNPGNETINLEGYGLSDNLEIPFKWVFPNLEMAADEYKIIWASGKDKKPSAQNYVNGIHRNVYTNIPGTSVDDLLNSPAFPDHPQTRQILKNYFEAPINIADDYGQQMYTWIKPPQSGEYVFWISGDDNSRLFLSSDLNPDNRILIAEVPGWTNSREWTKYEEQQSIPVFLEADSLYYLSALMKEGGGGDNLSVRWMLPDGVVDEPISIQYCFFEVKEIHTNFRISDGEKLVLTEPGGAVIDSMPRTIIPPNVSLGRRPGEFAQWYYFDQPTPGAINNTPSFIDILKEPVISPDSRLYHATNHLISIDAPEGTIYYTTDGTIPSQTNGSLYQTPFSISSSVLVSAIAVDDTKLNSQVSTASFIKSSSYSSTFSSDIPIMIIQHFGSSINDYSEADAYITLIDGGVSGISNINSKDFLQSRIKIKYRGSSSLNFPKKGYGFHLIDESGNYRKEPLLGMPEEHNWVLHGPYSDKTLMRNHLSYLMSEETGHYAPRTRFVELFMHSGNGSLVESQNHGVYLLVERIKVAEGRLELAALDPYHAEMPDVTGGYIFKYDRLNEGESGFTTRNGSLFAYDTPNEQTVTPQQTSYLIQYFDSVEVALSDITSGINSTKYAELIDVPSFIDYHLMIEVCKEIDGFRLSTFMHKDRDGKLKMGPVWDFNLSLGNADYLQGWNPRGWYYQQINSREYLYGWYNHLFQDELFKEQYHTRYRVLRQCAFSTQHIVGKILSNVDYLAEAQKRDQKKWKTMGNYVWPNWFIGENYNDEIDFMIDWVERRLNWMDVQLGNEYHLIHYWDFNNQFTLTENTFSIGGSAINIEPGLQTELVLGEEQNLNGGNSRLFKSIGTNMRLNNPVGSSIVFSLPSVGYENVAFSYETKRSNSGANTQYLDYSVDGTNFIPFDTIRVTTVPTFYTHGFSKYENTENNPDFAVRIRIANNNMALGGESGNVRFDNVTLDGDPLAGTNMPPVQTAQLPEVIEVVEGEIHRINLHDYFTDQNNDPLIFKVNKDGSQVFAVNIENNHLRINPYKPGDGLVHIVVGDGVNPEYKLSVRVLVYPAPTMIADGDFLFNYWDKSAPGGTFPNHMIFLQSDTNDPGLKTTLIYAYNIPVDDYATGDQASIGFPYRTGNRTRINGWDQEGISFINTGRERDLGAALLSLNTIGCGRVLIDWTASTILANSRQYALRPQYRIGLDGAWTNFTDSTGAFYEYQRNKISMLKQYYSNMPLPDEAIGHDLVQIAWRYHYTGYRNSKESGARDMLALHEIKVRNEKKNSVDDMDSHSTTLSHIYDHFDKTIRFNKTTTGTIYNILGKRMSRFEQSNSVDISHLPKGVYLCEPDASDVFRFIVR